MAMVNPIINPLQVKDSRWLTLEVCREFTRNKCTRSDQECKFAHPPPHVEVQNGRVTCCFDSIKGKCQRKDPPCKYLHPPQHLKEQLLQNGRNNLILKNLQMQALSTGLNPMVPGLIPPMVYEAGTSKASVGGYPQTTMLPGQYPMVAHPYLSAAMQNPYLPSVQMVSGMENLTNSTAGLSNTSPQVHGVVPNASAMTASTQKVGASGVTRTDRLEPSSSASSSGSDSSSWNGTYVDSLAPTSQYSPVYFQVPGVMPAGKRMAVPDNKTGMFPVYQPAASAAYQQAALAAMQLQQQQPFVPVTIAGHPPSMPRF